MLGPTVTVGAVALAAALAADELLSSLLVGPLIVGVAVSKADWAGIALERVLGVALRRVGLPVFVRRRRCTPTSTSWVRACSPRCSACSAP